MKIKNLPKIDGDLGWYELCEDKNETYAKLKEHKNFDICIIGAGISGISAALNLNTHFPKASIALVEALKIGQGTSSRNAGFIIDLPHNLDAANQNVEFDKKIYELNNLAISHLEQRVKEYNINCAWQKAGKYMAACEDFNIKGLDEFEKSLRACNFDFERIKAQDLEARLGTKYYQEAIYTPNNILMQPAALIRGLVKSLPQNISVFEQSAIIELEYGKIKKLKTYAGSLECEILVLALDSHLEEFKVVQNRQAPIFTYASLSEVLNDEELKCFQNVSFYGLTAAHPAGTTIRFTPDKRIFVRNFLEFLPKLCSDEHHLKKAYQKHRLSFEARFPHLKHKKFEYSWGGMLCMSLNHQAVFGEKEDGVFVIGASNGVGMAKGYYLGLYLADLIAKKPSFNLDFLLKYQASFMPFEPFKSIGAKFRLYYEQKNAGRDL